MNCPAINKEPRNRLQFRLQPFWPVACQLCLGPNKVVALAWALLFCVSQVGGGVAFAAAPEVRTVKDVYAPNEEIDIVFANLTGHPRDWIALAKRGAPDQRPLGRLKYLKGETSGRITLRGFGAGEYEVRAYRGGSKEVLARYPFSIQVVGRSAAQPPEAEPRALGEAPDAQVSRGQAGMQTSAKPLQPELQRLVGDWIGHTRCDIPGSGRDGQQEIFLSVREDSAKPGGIAAEISGIGNIAEIVLDVTLDADRQQYQFSFAEWSPTGGGSKTTPYGLNMAFLKDRELLAGEIISNDFKCATVVAGKLPSEDAPPNPQGLLSKVAGNRLLEPLTEEDCAAYGHWLAGGELSRAYGTALLFNSAVGDGPAMRRVLGHDLEQWTDDDTRKIRVIHRTCIRLLKQSNDPALIRLLNHEPRIWGGIAPPLNFPKSQYPKNWQETYLVLNRNTNQGRNSLLADIRKAWELIEEGVLKLPQNSIAAVPQDESGLSGEWRGYYQCEGGREVFMRLTFAAGDNPLDARFESGSSLKSIKPFGVLAMSGSFDDSSGRITLKPREWILEPRGQSQPLGFEGNLSEDGKSIAGQVEGDPRCPEFSLVKREVSDAPVNSDGLLFHYLGRDMIIAEPADCRDYAEWLVTGEEINLGGTYVFSEIRDAKTMRSVLGKDLSQWDADDWQKMLALSRHCKAMLESQMDTEVAELLARIKEKRLVWAPKPLAVPREERSGETTQQWLLAEQLVMVNAQQQELAARKLAEAGALPPEVTSIDRIDALTKEAGKRKQGPLGYLSQQELNAYLQGLQAARVKTAVATADAAAETWQSLPRTYAGLEQVETRYNDLRQQLETRKAVQGVNKLEENFRAATDQRADALWPEVLAATVAELRTLAEADLLRFKELGDDQGRQAYLAGFHPPESADSYFADYQAAMTLYRDTVERMVERSTSQLLAWIDELPPSAGANDLLDDFSMEVFGVNPIPERHAELKQATMAKKYSYNPERYLRPDIIMSLKRGQWNEVGLVGLEDLAYMATSLRAIKRSCPGTVPEGSPALTGFVWRLTQQAVRRILQGQVQSRREAERAFFLLMNNLINQPGCRVDYFGNVVGCVSQEDHAAVQEFFMTSIEAQTDIQKLLRSGCGSEGAGGYVKGLVAYAEGGRGLPPSPAVQDYWTWAGQRR